MRTLFCAFILSATTGLAAAQIPVPADVTDVEAQIAAGSEAWIDAYVAGDVDALAAMHAPDAVILSPNGRMFEGIEGIRAYYELTAGFTRNRRITVKENSIRDYGEFVIQNSTWDFQAELQNGAPFEARGRSSMVAAKRGNGWYIIDYHPAFNPPPMGQ